MSKIKIKLSKISAIHYFKLVFRSLLLLAAIAAYVASRIKGEEPLWERTSVTVNIIWWVFVVEMILRCFPSKYESMGCQKQFVRNYRPQPNANGIPDRQPWQRTFVVFLSWILLNGVIAALYYIGWIDRGILILVSLAYSVCDMICILFFCPFQTWMMKNKCCTSCRIYNWDYAMMFTPFFFIRGWFSWTLLGLSLILLLRWEVSYRLHPEHFYVSTNACLSCENCKEKLCTHKAQLRTFWKHEQKRVQRLKETIKQKTKKQS